MNHDTFLKEALAVITKEVGKRLSITPGSIGSDMSFVDLGVSSIQALEIIDSLNEMLGLTMGPETVFDYPTIETLGAYLAEIKPAEIKPIDIRPDTGPVDIISGLAPDENIAGLGSPEGAVEKKAKKESAKPARKESLEREYDIAVIGMAGRFPEAPDLDAYWKNLKKGASSIREIPENRWALDGFYDPDQKAKNRSYSRWGGFLSDIDRFDALFFNISPTEAELTDPQQRLCLEETMKAIENAGYRGEELRRQNCGVYIGCRSGDYLTLLNRRGVNLGAHAFMGNESSILAARISYYLDLKGPNIAIDTSCSSSLVALHMACESLRKRETGIALAGGVCLFSTQDFHILASKAGILSSTGECRPFDNGANGFVPGEGVGVVVLKRLSDAVRDRDHIHAVIKGSGINHDGKTNSITAPSARSQTDLLCAVYDAYGIDPSTITYLETHGTATRLGDPIEITALTNAFRKYTTREGYCAISSVKANIGHTITAAGLAGVIKLILCMKHQTLAPTPNFATPNAHIDFNTSPFFMVTRPEPWQPSSGAPRRAAVSSFGFSGTNAHVVLEEAPALLWGKDRPRHPYYFFPFSAKTPAALDQRLRDFADWLGREGCSAAIQDVAFTLLEGRHHYAHRCAVVAESLTALKEVLDNALKNHLGDNFIRGGTKAAEGAGSHLQAAFTAWLISELRNSATLKPKAEDHRLRLLALAERYTEGRDPGEFKIYDHTEYGRVPLPAYPFRGERHWVPDEKETPGKPENRLATPADGRSHSSRRTQSLGQTQSPERSRPSGLPLYRPVWRRAEADPGPPPQAESPSGTILLIHAREGRPLANAILEIYGPDTCGEILLGDHDRQISPRKFEVDTGDPDGLRHCLSRFPKIDSIYFLGGIAQKAPSPKDLDLFAHQQDTGVTALFRLIRAMDLGDGKEFRLKVVTNDACALPGSPVRNPMAAGLHGLCKSIAKEYPRIETICVDIGLSKVAEPAESASWREAAGQVAAVTGGPGGNEVAFRDGIRYRRCIEPLNLPQGADHPFRIHGVYLIVGGAGGIGLSLTSFLVKTVGARVVLVGRSPLDNAGINAKLGLLPEDDHVVYLKADAADPFGMHRVVQGVKERFGAIHGAFHSAIVLRDKRLARMAESDFQAVLSPKVRASLVLYRVLQDEPLDFICFFSSVQSFAGYPGQGNYAAACAFKDAYAAYIDHHTAFPVRTINWGYWGEVGIVSSAPYRSAMEKLGYQSIGVDEGVRAIGRLIRQSSPQVLAVRAADQALKHLGLDNSGKEESVVRHRPAYSLNDQPGDLPVGEVLEALNDYGRWLVMDAFREMGLFENPEKNLGKPSQLAARLRVMQRYDAHLRMILKDLLAAGFLETDEPGILMTTGRVEPAGRTTGLEAARERLSALLKDRPDLQPWPVLLERCLNRYPAILTGECSPLTVLFPRGSKETLENFYAGNTIADAYNQILADALVPRIIQRLAADPLTRVRILEAGAGTGSTSRVIFRAVGGSGNRIDYLYTDVSKAFVRHGEKRFADQYPFVRCQTLDLEKPPLSQGLEPGGVDMIVATNVLHATQDIAATLRHLKQMLKPGGWLMINELTQVDLFIALIFGITEGWWRFADPEKRLPDSPLLDREKWEHTLTEAGMRDIEFMGLPKTKYQSVITCTSDGVVTDSAEDRSYCEPERPKAVAPPQLQAAPAQASSETLRHGVLAYIQSVFSEILKIPAQEISATETFENFGVDSLINMDIIEGFEKDLGALPPTLLFEYITVTALADYFLGHHEEALKEKLIPGGDPAPGKGPINTDSPPPKTAEAVDSADAVEPVRNEPVTEAVSGHGIHAPRSVGRQSFCQCPDHQQGSSFKAAKARRLRRINHTTQGGATAANAVAADDGALMVDQDREERLDIAVIGMSGRYPMADDLDAFWDNLTQGRHCISRVPGNRWKDSRPSGNGANPAGYPWGGFLSDVDQFDPLFFNIAPAEAEAMDPQERLFLETAWALMEDAGYTREAFGRLDHQVGVFVGVLNADYEFLGAQHQARGGRTNAHSSYWAIANRVSYFFNFTGPSLAVDSACSSSLTALHLACRSIQCGDCRAAIAGGVNLILHPEHMNRWDDLNALSTVGRCKSFGAGADGFVPGEGVGAVLLKPLHLAEQDRDRIYGVIKGTAINADGKTSGFTVPSPQRQAKLLLASWRQAGLHPETIGYIEAHGTGTILGDPIEIAGLTRAFRHHTDAGECTAAGEYADGKRCAIGSVKSNIGHLESAAGIAGLTKVLLQMQHQKLAPSLNARELNPKIDFHTSPFRLQRELVDWDPPADTKGRPMPRRAGVSSFGAGGANAHVLVEEYFQRDDEVSIPRPHLVVLSAQKTASLCRAAENLRAYLSRHRHDLRLDALAWTLQTGREAMKERLAVLASTLPELEEKLARFTACESGIPGLYTGQAYGPSKPFSAAGTAGEFGETAAQLGKTAVQWVAGAMVDWSYMWPDGHPRRIALPAYPFSRERYWIQPAVSSSPEPLSRIPRLVAQGERPIFESWLERDTFYLRDHQVLGQIVLPGVMGLEMARRAVRKTLQREDFHLAHVMWIRPVVVNEAARKVRIDLEPCDGLIRFWMTPEDATDPAPPAMKGEAVLGRLAATPAVETIDIAAVTSRCQNQVDRDTFYRRLAAKGLTYGPGMQAVETLHHGDTEAMARLVLPASLAADFSEYGLHPAILDGALQATCALMPGKLCGSDTVWLPFALEKLTFHGKIPAACHVHVRLSRPVEDAAVRLYRFHIKIIDDTGVTRLELTDFTAAARRVDVPLAAEPGAGEPNIAEPDMAEHLYVRRVWRVDPGNPSQTESGAKTESAAPALENSVIFLENRGNIRKALQSSKTFSRSEKTRLIGVQPGERFEKTGSSSYRINPGIPGDYVRLLDALRGDGLPPSALVCLWPGRLRPSMNYSGLNYSAPDNRGSHRLDIHFAAAVHPVLFMTQALMSCRLKAPVRILVLYPETHGQEQPLHAALGGFARTARLENPNVRIRVIGVREDGAVKPTPGQMARVIGQELRIDDGPAVDIRHDGTKRWIQTVEEIPPDQGHLPLKAVKAGGVYLITGGGGALGRRFAACLAERGAGTIVLCGRSPASRIIDETLKSLKGLGAAAVYEQANLGRFDEVTALIHGIRERFGPIHGILHAAGVIRDALIVNKNLKDFYDVAGPKVFGTASLDDLTRSDPLDFFVMFSSIAAQLGNLGQCDYALCNNFMDHFAAFREKLCQKGERSGQTLSINWPLWDGGAMTVDEIARQRFRRAGYVPMSVSTGLEAFDKSLGLSLPQVMFIAGDREKIMGGLGMEKENDKKKAIDNKNEGVEGVLKGFCVDILKVRQKDLDPTEPFDRYGMDSVYMMKMLDRIETFYGRTVAADAIVGHPTIRELAAHLIDAGIARGKAPGDEGETSGKEPPLGKAPHPKASFEHAASSRPNPAQTAGEDCRVAVIGMACRFPRADGIEPYWDNLAAGRHLVTPFPEDRWQAGAFSRITKQDDIRKYARWGAFIDGIGRFDADFFKISEPDAMMMDPQHRILLEVSQTLLDDAGYGHREVSHSRTGLFIGGRESSYTQTYWKRIPESSQKHLIPCMIQNMMAARIANFYDFRGPAMVLDTACSSSLVAIDQACRSLWAGQCDMAVAGGVDLIMDPLVYLGFGRSGVLADGDRCHVFDRRADGFTIGEGAGLVLLKPLRAAMADGNRIYGVIQGSTVNNDGYSMGATVPSLEGQKSVIQNALKASGVSPDTISLLEAHGTGTLLGDPIEIKAISEVYREYTDRCGTCAVGSVKSNMGHLLRAAGVASFIKVMLALKHRMIPPTLHCDDPHPRFDFESTPFYPALETEEWIPGKGPRRAAVSAFGFGGTNCHLIVGELPEDLGYSATRQALPRTVFKRKTFWLGENEENERTGTASFDEDAARELLSRLQRGELTVEKALAQEAG